MKVIVYLNHPFLGYLVGWLKQTTMLESLLQIGISFVTWFKSILEV